MDIFMAQQHREICGWFQKWNMRPRTTMIAARTLIGGIALCILVNATKNATFTNL